MNEDLCFVEHLKCFLKVNSKVFKKFEKKINFIIFLNKILNQPKLEKNVDPDPNYFIFDPQNW